LGGHGFSVEVSPGEAIHARWRDGTVETGYQPLRIDLSGGTGVSSLGQLGPTATGVDDANPPAIACYVVLVQSGTPQGYGQSDAECAFLGVASGRIPLHFKIQLNELPTAVLTWAAPAAGDQIGYTMVVIPVDGSGPIQFIPINNSQATAFAHDTGGHITCYQLLVTGGGGGQSNAVCAFPNGNTLAAGAATTQAAALDQVRSRLQLPAGSISPMGAERAR
jgi:hypothetical protein